MRRAHLAWIAASAHRDHFVNALMKQVDGRAGAQPPDSWNEIGQIQEVKWVDATERIEIDSHRVAQFAAVSRNAVRKNRALHYRQGEFRHLIGDIYDLAFVRAPSLDQIAYRAQYHRYEAPHVPERENRRERTAL